MNALKSMIRPIIRLHPRGEAIARHVLFQLWRLKARVISYSKDFDVINTYWVDPNIIQYALSERNFNKYRDMGKITGGDWDVDNIHFSQLDIYRAFHDHFLRNKAWQDTDFYQRVLHEIDTGNDRWDCTSKSHFDARLHKLDSLYEDIKVNGYKSQEELFTTAMSHPPPIQILDEIAVRIGRHGDILLQDGQHRLAIAQLLKVPQVPLKITVRHSEWYRLRKEILNYARNHRNTVYQPLTHIDLRDIPSLHGEKRFDIIKPYLPKQKGTLLDLGAHWGYFCHKCEVDGFNCYAIENDIRNIYFMRTLKRAENRKFEVIEESVLNYKREMHFNVVIALNIFHHFLKYEHTYHKLIEFLRNVDAEIMFFEPHLPNEQQMVGAYKNYGCEKFEEFLLRHCTLNYSKLIGKAEDGRPIYMLYK